MTNLNEVIFVFTNSINIIISGYLGGVHAKHNKYSLHITRKIENIYEDISELPVPLNTKIEIFDVELKKLVYQTKLLTIENSIKNNIKINNLFE